MSEKTKLEEGQEVTINIPFTYRIGDIGYCTNKKLLTVEDCKNEVRCEIENNVINGNNVFLVVVK